MRRNFKKFATITAFAAMAALVCVALGACGSSSSTSSTSSQATASDATYTLVSDGTLTVATSPDYPPFENLEDGEYVGFDIDMAKAIADKLGLDIEFKTIQFDGIIAAIQTGGQADVGISGFSVDPERAELIDFTDSYYVDDQAIVVMNDSDITSDNVDSALNAKDIVIAAQSGSTGETYAKENFSKATVKGYGNATDCFAAMQSGKADAVAINKSVADKMVAESYTDAYVVKSEATGEDYAMVVSKDNPELTAAINEALAELQSDGTIETLEQQDLS